MRKVDRFGSKLMVSVQQMSQGSQVTTTHGSALLVLESIPTRKKLALGFWENCQQEGALANVGRCSEYQNVARNKETSQTGSAALQKLGRTQYSESKG